MEIQTAEERLVRSMSGIRRLPCTWRVLFYLSILSWTSAQRLAPIVGDITPSNGPTKGGTIITIGGSNFGTADSDVQPRVTVGGAACPQVVWVSATSVLCETPDGVGADRAIIVEVGSFSSVVNPQAEFNYDAPKVAAIEPGRKEFLVIFDLMIEFCVFPWIHGTHTRTMICVYRNTL